jgi:hypothetical protein
MIIAIPPQLAVVALPVFVPIAAAIKTIISD